MNLCKIFLFIDIRAKPNCKNLTNNCNNILLALKALIKY